MPGRIQADERRPHFFLSYARSRYRPEGSDPDRWVAKLYADLCQDVGQATGKPVPGFMDRQIPVGTSWPDHLADALSNCRVFVALFSPAYFTSEYCGKEWAAFLERAERQSAGRQDPFAIIPAMWTPLRITELPSSLHSMQNVQPGFPPAYATEGLYGIMKLGRYREQYKETVLRLANIIKERAAECDLAAGPISDLDSLLNPFAESPPAGTRQPIRIMLAAQRLDQLPQDRDTYYYGRTWREWNPFRNPDQTLPIATFAEQVLTELGHQSIVDGIDEPARDAAHSPTVLIIDPWATKDPAIRDRLKQLEVNPVNVIVPFNAEDQETASSATELANSVGEMLPKSIALNGSDMRIPTINAFRNALPKAVNEAITRFFKTTETYPPLTPPTIQRPRLDGPDF
jgi:FxsC-like protein